MKLFISLLTVVFTITGLAQQMPYNPDANGDDFVGVDDVLGVLGVYDTALMQPDLQCEYEGTDLEQLIGGIFDQTLVLDSVYIEYLYSDSILTYLPGCPNPVYVETILERSYVIDDFSVGQSTDEISVMGVIYPLNFTRRLEFRFYPENGVYKLYLQDWELASITNFPYTSEWQGQDYNSAFMPFPDGWTLNDDGLIVEWDAGDWAANCEQFRLIPFWHEAE